ncbi:hypothetical protein AGOR_G00089190 [Albula goreensis]|uniref:non-specific serine/threonine protein kinase n=1 Tax=Albula goreensis TaxID=1534307 RepID=A0A8T3DRM0_9TELE|nr:hypothetical protein AGOR_G00089190 [Albula goreensis]
MLKGEYVTTYRDDFKIPALAQQKTELGKRKPLIRPYPEKRDIPTYPCKEKRVTSPRPGRDMGGASASHGQKRGAPPRPAQEKKVAPLPVKDKLTSPQPVGKVAPTRPDQKVTLPPHNLPKAPEPDPEGRTSPLHLVRKVAPARPFQKVALPNHVQKMAPHQPVQEKMLTPPFPVQKFSPSCSNMEEVGHEIQLYLENKAAQIQFNLEERAAQIQLKLEEKATQIQLNLGQKEAQILSNLEKTAAQIQLHVERKEAEIQCNLENVAAQIQLTLEERAAQIQFNLEKKEAEIQLNLEAMVAQIQLNMEEKAAQTQLNLDTKEAQIQLNLEEIAAQIQFNLQHIVAKIQFNPEEMDRGFLEETYSEVQRDLQPNFAPPKDEMEGKAKNGSCPGLSPNCFVFHKVLGKGAFGKVMLAELKESGEHFAVKSLRKDHILINGHVECTKVERRVLALASESPFLTHLHSTFQTKVMIQTHATHLYTCHLSEANNTYSPTHLYSRHLDKGNAPCPHEYFTFPTKDCLYFVMEYVRGRDLYFYIVEKGHFERHTAEDLKLSNVMLDGEGHVKIVDFGLCKDKLLDGKAMSFCGTEQYIAPEIFQGQEYSFEVDWWSLGVLIYEMLTGDSPFQGDNNDELSVSVCTDIPEYPSWIDPESKDLMEKVYSGLSNCVCVHTVRLAQCTSNREEVVGDLGPHLFRSFRTAVATEKRERASESKLKGGESREEHCGEPWAATKAGRRGKEALK